MYAEDIMPTDAVAVPVASVSVSSHEPSLVNLVGHVLFLSSISYDSYNLSSSVVGFLNLQGKVPDGDHHFRHSSSIMSGCPAVSLYSLSYLVLEEASLMTSAQGTDLRI